MVSPLSWQAIKGGPCHRLGGTDTHTVRKHSQACNHSFQARSLSFQDSIKLTYMNSRYSILRSDDLNQYKSLCLGS
jgi:hypothetical protein